MTRKLIKISNQAEKGRQKAVNFATFGNSSGMEASDSH